jgi:hypothetical protein
VVHTDRRVRNPGDGLGEPVVRDVRRPGHGTGRELEHATVQAHRAGPERDEPVAPAVVVADHVVQFAARRHEAVEYVVQVAYDFRCRGRAVEYVPRGRQVRVGRGAPVDDLGQDRQLVAVHARNAHPRAPGPALVEVPVGR